MRALARWTASVLCAALFVAAPGVAPYQALAANIVNPVAGGHAVSGVPGIAPIAGLAPALGGADAAFPDLAGAASLGALASPAGLGADVAVGLPPSAIANAAAALEAAPAALNAAGAAQAVLPLPQAAGDASASAGGQGRSAAPAAQAQDQQVEALGSATFRGRPLAALGRRFGELLAFFSRKASDDAPAPGAALSEFDAGRADAARAYAGEAVAVPAAAGERLAGVATEISERGKGTPPQALVLQELGASAGQDLRVVITRLGQAALLASPALAPANGSLALAPSAVAADVPAPAAAAERLVYDLQDASFRAGYLAAMAREPGQAVEAPASETEKFMRGFAYRVAEVHGDAAAAAAFLSDAKLSGGVESAADSFLTGQRRAPSLRANLADPDYAQGYVTAAAWRPGKQVLLPAPSFWQRFNPWAGAALRARDERFMEGLYAALRESADPGREAALRSELAGGPAVGSREFVDKLLFSLEAVLKKSYDERLDKALPFVPGKTVIPRSIIGLTIGHVGFIMLGINIHMNAQPFLVLGITHSKAMMGVIRNYHFTSYMVSNLLPIGPTIDKTDFRTLFTWTSVARALLMAAIPVLFSAGYLSFGVLVMIVLLNPFFQNLMTNSDQTARAIILREDPNLVREGAAFKETFSAAAGLAMPFVAAYLVSLLVSVFGDPAGYAAAYGLYAAALLIAIPIFQLMVRDPRYHDPAVAQKPSRNPLNILEPLWTAVTAPARAIARFLGLLLRRSARPIAGSAWARRFAIFLRHQGWPVAGLRLSRLLRWLRGLPASAEETAARATLLAAARARDVALETLGPVKAVRERLARFFDRRETTQGLAAILRSDTLSILMTVATIEMFLADAMMMVLMPNYIVDVLHPRPELASIPFIGQFLSTKAGIGGLMFGLANIGAFLAARWVSGPKGQERIARLGHPRLYHAAAVGSLLFWAMMIPIYLTPPGAAAALPLFFASLGVFLAMQFATTLLHRPLMISMAQVQRAQIPNDRAGRVIQALTMIEVGLMALGSLLVGLIVDGLGISTAVFILAFGVSGTAILQWLAPRWLGKIAPKGWEPGRKA